MNSDNTNSGMVSLFVAEINLNTTDVSDGAGACDCQCDCNSCDCYDCNYNAPG